jgi:hypothetical protein
MVSQPIIDSVARYLMTTLGLNPYLDVSSSKPVVLQLHDVENALANVVAMTFWAGDYFRLHI